MRGKAIIVKDLSDVQLDILVNYLRNNNYRWFSSGELDVISIIRGEVLYMDNDKILSFSGLGFLEFNKQDYKLVTFNEIQMKKSDLKPGMVVEYENGNKRLVTAINNELFLMGEHMFCRLEIFNDDLTCDNDPKINIVKVYQPKEAANLNSLLDCKNCIWERQKETVLTMQEIADKFDIPVEQLKIKQ